jgi:hypothetical protein
MHLLSGTSLHLRIHSNKKEFKENFLHDAIVDYVGICCNNCEGILARFDLSTLNFRGQHLDALFLIDVFKSKISCSSTPDSFSTWIPTRIIIDYSIFIVNHNFRVSLSARCVSAAIAIFKDIDSHNKDYIMLTDTL